MSALSDEFEKWWKAVSNDEHVPIGIEDRHVARLAWSAAIAAADRAARAEPVAWMWLFPGDETQFTDNAHVAEHYRSEGFDVQALGILEKAK